MVADIAGAERAEHRVGQRMEDDVGVAMAGKAACRGGSATPPSHRPSPAAKAWTSKPRPVRGRQPGGELPRRGAKSAS